MKVYLQAAGLVPVNTAIILNYYDKRVIYG